MPCRSSCRLPVVLFAVVACLGLATENAVGDVRLTLRPQAGMVGGTDPDDTAMSILAALAARPPEAKLAQALAFGAASASQTVRQRVAVVSMQPFDVRAYAKRWHTFRWPAGEWVTLVDLRPSDLRRIAALPQVAWLASGEVSVGAEPLETADRLAIGRPPSARSWQPLTLPRGAPSAAATRPESEIPWDRLSRALGGRAATPDQRGTPLKAADRADRPAAGLRPAGNSVPPTTVDRGGSSAGGQLAGWFDARNGHRASEAWAAGWRGQGVRVAVLDTGVDFGHQDLQEAWVVLPEGHPFAGWPQIYDPTAAYAFVVARKLSGEREALRRGQVSLVEPYQEVATEHLPGDPAGATACLQPLLLMPDGTVRLAASCVNHQVPVSQSGRVRYGHHPDTFLARIPLPPSNTEIYSPLADSWEAAASLPATRFRIAAVSLADGHVLAVGGLSPDGAPAKRAYQFDPASGTWTAAGETAFEYPTPQAVRMLDGTVLVIGSQGCEIYDPATNAWRQTASPLEAHGEEGTATVLTDGRVLLAGGRSEEEVATSRAELYHPATGTWTAAASMRTPRRQHVAVRLADGRVLLAGGIGSTILANAEVYDPGKNTWSDVASLKAARSRALAAVLPNGRVLVTGGADDAGHHLVTSEVFDPATQLWLPAGDSASQHFEGTLTPLANGNVLLVGGYSAAAVPGAAVERFDPATLSWLPAAPMLAARTMHSAAPMPGDRVLVVGGYSPASVDPTAPTEYAGVLLVDRDVAGRYDTVYVDLNKDHDFRDEKPVTKSSPLSTRDLDDDGIADLSGGLLYYLADGTLPIPGAYLWGVEDEVPAPGSLLGLLVDNGIHGTLCASNVASRGRLGPPPWTPTYRDLEPGVPAAINPGMAPDAAVVAVGDAYSGFLSMATAWRYVVFGHDPGRSDDDIQIASNSYGFSNVDADGWEADGRLMDHYVRRFAPWLAWVKATGNGAPGYGTLTAPAPATAIMVGASTQHGASSTLSITDTNQITYGDVAGFSNRGPTASGRGGPDILANGSDGWGALPLAVLPAFSGLGLSMPLGAWANQPWAGTSRSTPVTAGGLAVVYQAFHDRHGRWPGAEEARAIVMAGARYTGYNAFAGGAGVMDIAAAARIAAGQHGIYAIPPSWTAGGYRGSSAPAFAKIMHPGDSASATLQLHNPMASPIDVRLSAGRLVEIGSTDLSLNTKLATESDYTTAIPNYLVAIDKALIPKDTELLVVHAILPMELADVNGDNSPQLENSFRIRLLRHTDHNRNLRLWRDTNLNKAVNFEQDDQGNINWATAEIDRYEYEALNEDLAETNTWAVSVHHPLERWSSGLYIGVWHGPMDCEDEAKPATCVGRTPLAPDTRIQFRLYFYRYQDWPWLKLQGTTTRLPAQQATPLVAELRVPADAAAGAYEGAIFVDYDRSPDDARLPTGGGYELQERRLTIPVNVNVALRYAWRGSLTLGGATARAERLPYDNGAVAGLQDRLWRMETGDWRFFFLDAEAPQAGTFWLTRTRWQDRAASSSDIDTSVWGPNGDRFSDPRHPANRNDDWSDPQWFGPYTLERLGMSASAYRGNGTWARRTSSGADEDWLAAPARSGLHEVILHNVRSSGSIHELPFETTVSSIQVSTAPLTLFGEACRDIHLISQVELPGLALTAAGLVGPWRWPDGRIDADEIVTRTLTLPEPAAQFDVTLVSPPDTQLALVVWHDANGDGRTGDDELIAVSLDNASQQFISLSGIQPPGEYVIGVAAQSVPAGGTEFDLVADIAYGHGLRLDGAKPSALAAGEPLAIRVCPAGQPAGAGPLQGVVAVGTGSSAAVLRIPVTWYAQPPYSLALPRLSRQSAP